MTKSKIYYCRCKQDALYEYKSDIKMIKDALDKKINDDKFKIKLKWWRRFFKKDRDIAKICEAILNENKDKILSKMRHDFKMGCLYGFNNEKK